MALLGGCTTAVVTHNALHAQTSYQQLAPPANIKRYRVAPGEVAIPSALRQHVKPVYPPVLLHRQGVAPVTVLARLVIDKAGHVTRVEPVADQKKAEPHYASFVAAAKAAVLQWRFYPYRVQIPQANGTVKQVSKPTTLWYEFHFTVINGKAIVGVHENNQ